MAVDLQDEDSAPEALAVLAAAEGSAGAVPLADGKN